MEQLYHLPTLIFGEARYQNLHALLVMQRGEMLFEGYFQGYSADTLHEAQSVTKSIQSLLVGIAVDKKFIPSLDVKIKDYFPQYAHLDWRKGKSEITLRHVLTMTSGLQWNEGEIPYSAYYQNDANLQILQEDWVAYALSKPMQYEAGKQFAYSSASPILLSHILREATKLPNELFALHYLYMPLGITEYGYQKSKHDEEILADVDFLPVDLLKIGQMVLQQGRFGAHQIVSPSWIYESLQAHVGDLPAGKNYGYMWWSDVARLRSGEAVRYHYAWGYGGQHIFIVPDYEIVVVTTGNYYKTTLAEPPFELLKNEILPKLVG